MSKDKKNTTIPKQNQRPLEHKDKDMNQPNFDLHREI